MFLLFINPPSFWSCPKKVSLVALMTNWLAGNLDAYFLGPLHGILIIWSINAKARNWTAMLESEVFFLEISVTSLLLEGFLIRLQGELSEMIIDMSQWKTQVQEMMGNKGFLFQFEIDSCFFFCSLVYPFQFGGQRLFIGGGSVCVCVWSKKKHGIFCLTLTRANPRVTPAY